MRQIWHNSIRVKVRGRKEPESKNFRPKINYFELQFKEDACEQRWANWEKYKYGYMINIIISNKQSYATEMVKSSLRGFFGKANSSVSSSSSIKGIVSWDRFQKCWRKWTDLGLNKGRGWFLNFSETPLIFSLNKTSGSRKCWNDAHSLCSPINFVTELPASLPPCRLFQRKIEVSNFLWCAATPPDCYCTSVNTFALLLA